MLVWRHPTDRGYPFKEYVIWTSLLGMSRVVRPNGQDRGRSKRDKPRLGGKGSPPLSYPMPRTVYTRALIGAKRAGPKA